MGSVLSYIAKKTGGNCYSSFKYCFDNIETPNIIYDDSVNHINLKEYAETIPNEKFKDIKTLADQIKNDKPLFKFFLDGSRRVYKVDDICFNNKKVFPIVAGQVVVSCCQREMNKSLFADFKQTELEDYVVLVLPNEANTEGGDSEVYFRNLCLNVNENIKPKVENIKIEKILPYSTKINKDESLENKGIARIQDEMVNCEKKIVANMMNKHLLSQDAYLLKDGSLQYKVMKTGDYKELANIKNNYRHVVGISKSFNLELMKDKNDKSIAGKIAELPLYHRTPAFLYSPADDVCGNVKFAIWYVRIRDRNVTTTPFSGVLKIEKILVTNQETENGLESDEIDLITANVINERNPVCYGNDSRWANHLYPVYLTEQYCKSKFLSEAYFINIF